MAPRSVPTITLLKDANGAKLGEGATTSHPPVTIDGFASTSNFIEIHDDDGLIGTAFVGISGFWSCHLRSLSIGKHRVFAKNKAGESAVTTFEVVATRAARL
ncbi:hypothetical protein [Pseudomonas sp. TH15]|uniref:hypothetical protein n=1 Tax=Pseudomonas sp. TH15 TaxID=2796381 RepID=UPI001911543E|nr:hypothetical protein [Pseudomonas sp. TH15]MBK5510474.1 hypothetical protein [Pseudomonas sp. TH15]